MFFEPSPFCDTLLFNFHLINLLDQLHKLVCKRILIGNTKIELRRSSCPEDHPYNYCDITDESWKIERKKRRTNDKWYNVKKGGKNDEIKPNWKEFPQLFSRTDKWKHHFLQRKTAFKTVIIRDMKYVKKFPTRELSFHPFTNDFLFVSKTKKSGHHFEKWRKFGFVNDPGQFASWD